MNVIDPSCTLPSDTSQACGCAALRNADGKPSGKTARRVAGVATATALAAVTCTACCVLPFTLPAVLLAAAGGSIVVLDHAHGWMTRLSIGVVVCAWLWIGWQVARTRQPLARATIVFMLLATLLTATTASWPLLEQPVAKALGIVKKQPVLTTQG
jgi:hypothetical protein